MKLLFRSPEKWFFWDTTFAFFTDGENRKGRISNIMKLFFRSPEKWVFWDTTFAIVTDDVLWYYLFSRCLNFAEGWQETISRGLKFAHVLEREISTSGNQNDSTLGHG